MNKILSLERKIRNLGLIKEAVYLKRMAQEWTDNPMSREMDIIGREISRKKNDWSSLKRLQQAELNESGVWDTTHYSSGNIENTNKWMSHVAKEIADILHLSAPAFIGASGRKVMAAGAYAWSVSLPNGDSAVLKICRKEELMPYKRLVSSGKNISLLPKVYLAKTFEEFDKIIPGGYKPPPFSEDYAVVLMEELIPAPKDIIDLISDNPIEINSMRIFASDRENILRLADMLYDKDFKTFFEYNYKPQQYNFSESNKENFEKFKKSEEEYKNIMSNISVNIKELYYFMLKNFIDDIIKESSDKNIKTLYNFNQNKFIEIATNFYTKNKDKLKNIFKDLFLFSSLTYKNKETLDETVDLFIKESSQNLLSILNNDFFDEAGSFFHKASKGSELVSSQKNRFEKEMKKIISMGLVPSDLHDDNIMMRPDTMEIVISDIGHFYDYFSGNIPRIPEKTEY